jgi:polysaccharide pyruvyl transferase WcaK-like protein
VLYEKCGGQLYVSLMAAVIEQLLEDNPGASVWLIAHAYRAGDSLSNNDAPVCKEIHASLSDWARERVRLVAGDYTPGEMKTIIGETDAFLACRFHAMVGALSMGVPVAVVGWSHKYREVQAQFGLDYCLDHRTATVESVCHVFQEVILQRESIERRIQAALPGVRSSSVRNFVVLEEFLRGPLLRPGEAS